MKKAASIPQTIARVVPLPAGAAAREAERVLVRLLARQAAAAYVAALRDRDGRG